MVLIPSRSLKHVSVPGTVSQISVQSDTTSTDDHMLIRWLADINIDSLETTNCPNVDVQRTEGKLNCLMFTEPVNKGTVFLLGYVDETAAGNRRDAASAFRQNTFPGTIFERVKNDVAAKLIHNPEFTSLLFPFHFHRKVSWETASDLCGRIGGYLPFFHSLEEQSNFLALIKRTKIQVPIEAMYIGLRYFSQVSSFFLFQERDRERERERACVPGARMRALCDHL